MLVEDGIFAVWHSLRLLPAFPVSIWHDRHLYVRKQAAHQPSQSRHPARSWQPCPYGGRRWHSHFYGWLSLTDPTEPMLTGGLDYSTLCMPSYCTTKLLRVQAKEKSRKSGADVSGSCWLLSDPRCSMHCVPCGGSTLTGEPQGHAVLAMHFSLSHPARGSCTKWLTPPLPWCTLLSFSAVPINPMRLGRGQPPPGTQRVLSQSRTEKPK